MTMRELKRSALVSCQWREHNMSRFYRDNPECTQYTAQCKTCGKQVTVRTRPAPNQINIAGEAVALNCN